MINMKKPIVFILFFLILISLPISTVSALTLETDKAKYNPSDQITVTGTGYINDYVTVQLLGSNGDLKAIAQGQCDEEGNYVIVLTTFPSAETTTFKFGDYTVKATSSGNVFSKSITFEASVAPTTTVATTTSETTQTVTETQIIEAETQTVTEITENVMIETQTITETTEDVMTATQTLTKTKTMTETLEAATVEVTKTETEVEKEVETVLDVSIVTATDVKIVTDVSIVTETKMITDVKTITAQEMESNQNQMSLSQWGLLVVIIGVIIGFIAYRNKDTIIQKIKR